MGAGFVKHVPLLVPDVPRSEEILPFLRDIDEARWYTNFGPLVQRFERNLAQELALHASSVVTTANCTIALELALGMLGLIGGSTILIPALTFAATASAVRRAGLGVGVSDIDRDSWLLTPDIARKAAANRRISCVIPVAAFGCPHPVEGWDRFTEETGIPVLIDAAGAFGNQMVGHTTLVAYSFHATKSLGIGEGGMLAARDRGILKRLRQLTNFGIDISSGNATQIGTNGKLSEFHAAVGLAALATWRTKCQARLRILECYAAQLALLCPGVTLQERPADGIYTIMQILLPVHVHRARVVASLREKGIETRAWYLPLIPDHPAFSPIEEGEIPVARELAIRMLGLPFHPSMSEADVEHVCASLQDTLRVVG